MKILGADEFRYKQKNEISGIYLINEKTISITLKNDFEPFLKYLAGPGGYIIPQEGLANLGGNVIGAGPYKVKWRDEGRMAIERAWTATGIANFDSIVFIYFDDSEEAALSLELGNIDLLPLLGDPPPKFVSSSDNSSIESKTWCSAVLGINGQRDYQQNGNFAKALYHLIDRETIIRVILGNSAVLTENVLPGYGNVSLVTEYGSYSDSVDYYLSKAGRIPKSMNFYVDARYPSMGKIASYIGGQLRFKGIETEIISIDLSSLTRKEAESNLDLYLTYLTPVSNSPDCQLEALFSEILSGHTNYLFYDDSPFQTFLSYYSKETDPGKKESYIYGLAQSVLKEPPVLLLYQPHLTTIYKKDLSGILVSKSGYVDLSEAYIEY
jgi:ABC-type transport system substrate-binding protein